jgi:YegS/Rv2252/BmrU family lipid kinase
MARPVPVILNATAGTGAAEARAQAIREAFTASGMEAHVMQGEDIGLLARRAVREGHEIVVAAGGDGTVNAVASQVVGSRTALGVIPMGTLNHFAQDAGIPLDLPAAAKVIAAGYRASIDVGVVNGRIFINNSSIGLYPTVVIRRENRRKRTGSGKWTALAWASFSVLRRHPMMDVTLHVDGNARRHRTPLLFIGNNEYVVRGPEAGKRQELCDGKLSIYITRRHGRLGLIALFLRALFGSLRKALDLEAFQAARVTIATRRRYVAVATDGEVSVMATPLEYESRPGALQIIGPAPANGEKTP